MNNIHDLLNDINHDIAILIGSDEDNIKRIAELASRRDFEIMDVFYDDNGSLVGIDLIKGDGAYLINREGRSWKLTSS